jgi:hypothetical protein
VLLVSTLVAPAAAEAQSLIVSRTVYPTGSGVPSITPGVTKLPNGATAVGDGTFANVFKNESVDPSFGVTTSIVIDRRTLAGAVLGSYSPLPSQQIVTSFASKSELGLNVTDGRYVTFMGYVAPTSALDVSNANTATVIDPTNPVTSTYSRAVGVFDVVNQTFSATPVGAYSGNNGRAAVLGDNGMFYMAGNAGNSGSGVSGTVLGQLSDNTGVQMIANGSSGATTVVGAVNGTFGNTTGYQRGFSVTQLGLSADKTGKDDNFRGLTMFDNTLYVTKGSGSNGVNTVYQVGTAGTLPTLATAGSTPISILPGFPTKSLAGKADVSTHPFGLWFGNATTLFVADEGDGTTTGGAFAGLGEYKLAGGIWSEVANFSSGLIGQPSYTQGLGWNIFTSGLRNLTGIANDDGSFQLWATTATTSDDPGHDQGADPNELVTTTVNANGTATPFSVLERASAGERFGGVSIASTPEPSTWVLMLTGMATLGGVRWRRQRHAA